MTKTVEHHFFGHSKKTSDVSWFAMAALPHLFITLGFPETSSRTDQNDLVPSKLFLLIMGELSCCTPIARFGITKLQWACHNYHKDTVSYLPPSLRTYLVSLNFIWSGQISVVLPKLNAFFRFSHAWALSLRRLSVDFALSPLFTSSRVGFFGSRQGLLPSPSPRVPFFPLSPSCILADIVEIKSSHVITT